MNQTLMQQQTQEKEFNLHDVISFVLGNRTWLIAGMVLGLLIGFVYALIQTPMYSAQTTLQTTVNSSAKSVDQFGMLMGQQDNSLTASVPVFKSRSLAEQVVQRLALNAQIENISDISAIKSLQRRIRRFIDPPESLQYMGWSGKTRYYVAKIFGDPGPIGGMTVKNLSVDNAVSSYPLTIKLLPDNSGFRVLDDDGKLLSSCLAQALCQVKFPNGKISFEADTLRAGYDTTLKMTFQPFLAAASRVREGIEVKMADKNANFLEISFTWPEPSQAAKILATLTEAFNERDRQSKTRSQDQVVDFLDQALPQMQLRLQNADRDYRLFLKGKKMFDVGLQYQQGAQNITDFSNQQLQAELESQQLDYLADLLKKKDAVISSGTLISGVSPNLAEEWNTVIQKTAELELAGKELEGFTNEYPAKKRLIAAIADLDKQKETLRQKALTAIRDKQTLLASKNNLLGNTAGKVQDSLSLEADTQVTIMLLARNKAIAEKLYGMMQEKREELRLARAGEISSLQVLDPPLPGNQVSPVVARSTLLGGILGLLALGFVAFVRETLDIGIKDPADIERMTGLYLHGMVPLHKEAVEWGQGLVTMVRSNSAAAEAYRSLRTSIQLASLEKKVTSIMITSSGPGEGKSTTMSNLAVTLAQAGRKTLIVDCDMRRPVVNTFFGLNREPGLSEILTDHLDWRGHIKPTEVDGLFVLPAGKIPQNPSELIGRQHMADILAEMKQEYDFVLCDVPPILVVSDAALLASHLDGVLILVRSGLAVAHDVARAAEQMERVGGKVIGAVFNAMDSEGGRYGKYGYGKYGYGTGGYSHYAYGNAGDETGSWRKSALQQNVERIQEIVNRISARFKKPRP